MHSRERNDSLALRWALVLVVSGVLISLFLYFSYVIYHASWQPVPRACCGPRDANEMHPAVVRPPQQASRWHSAKLLQHKRALPRHDEVTSSSRSASPDLAGADGSPPESTRLLGGSVGIIGAAHSDASTAHQQRDSGHHVSFPLQRTRTRAAASSRFRQKWTPEPQKWHRLQPTPNPTPNPTPSIKIIFLPPTPNTNHKRNN